MQLKASISALALTTALPPQTAAQALAGAPPTLDTLVVTAQKREQSLEDVAASITVFGGEALTERGALEVKDIGQLTPNVQIEGTYGNASNPIITIRGVGIEDFNDNNSSPAGVYVDEVYYVAPPMLAFGLFDLERVEVLKGPQGTLYGRNTTSGAVNFISRKPTDSFEAYGRVSRESYDRTSLEGALSGPISETMAMRVAGMRDHGGDHTENRFTGKKNGGRDFVAGRALILWQPSAAVDVLANVHAARDKSDIGQYQHVGFLADPATFTPCAAAVAGRLDPRACVDPLGYSDSDGDVLAGDYNRRGRLDYDSLGGSINLKWRLSRDLDLTAITAFEGFDGVRIEDSDASPNRLLEIDYDVDVEQFSQELRLNGRVGSLDWIAGAYYGKDEIEVINDYDAFRDLRPLTGGPDFETIFLARNAYVQNTEVAAVFGHGFWAFTEGWTAEAGLRLSREERDFRTISSFREDAEDLALIGLGPDGRFLDETRSIEDSDLAWTLGLSREFGRHGLIYAKVSNGFKSGGFNGGMPFNPDEVVPFDEETLLAYEVGLKGAAVAGTLRYEAAAFYYDYRDLQVFTLADTDSPVPVQILTNAADSEIYGIDAALSWLATEGLDLSVGLGLLSAKYVDANIGGRDVSGRPLANAPKVSLTLGLDYERPVGPLIGRLGVNTAYQSKERLEDFEIVAGESTIIEEPGYWLVDLRAALRTPDGRYEFAVLAKNLLNEKPLVSTLSLPDFGFSEYTYGLPRRVGASFTLRY